MKKELSNSFSTGFISNFLLTSLLVLCSLSSGFSHSHSKENPSWVPMAICQDVTVQLDVNGMTSIVAADVDNGSNDNGNPVTLSLSGTTAFTCANIGSNTVTLTATSGGLMDDCTATVTIQDNIAPVAICQNATVILDAMGNGTLLGSQINNGSTDACGIGPLMLSVSAFTCADIGTNLVMLTVADMNGNNSTCNATVTVVDNIAPVANCQNITVELNAAGNISITAAQINNGSSDNCTIAGLSLNTTSFTCTNIGNQTVTLTVMDGNGNMDTCDATVTVEDNLAPTAICQNANVTLNAAGNGSIVATTLNGGSTDNCNNLTFSASQTAFTCADIGTVNVTLTVDDNNGQTATCPATVTITEIVPPMAICQNITIQLDAAGNANIVATDINNGSSDICSPVTLSVSQTDFSCANVGANSVTLTVTDASMNVETCMATVAVEDNIAPTALCQAATIQLNEATNEATLTVANINNGSSDNCGIASLVVSPMVFDCDDLGNGNTATLTVTDNNSNVSTCTATITVEDDIDPRAICTGVTVQLDAAGNASITTADINNGSTDNCTAAADLILSLNTTNFTCANVGNNTVTLTVTDENGNSITCNTNVLVTENMNPIANCQNVDVILDVDGIGMIDANLINNGSSDICGITSVSTNNPAVDCSNVGIVPVILTVTDNNGNIATCTADITVIDNTPPVATCQGISINLDATGNITIAEDAINNGSSDACGIMTFDSDMTAFTCANLGNNLVTLTVTDNNSNFATCTANVLVNETLGNPMCSVTPDITMESNDVCDIMVMFTAPTITGCNYTLDSNNFSPGDLFPQGTTTVNYVFINSVNTQTCSFDVTITDNVAMNSPTLDCSNLQMPPISVSTNMGMCVASGLILAPSQSDNCMGVLTLTYQISGATMGSGMDVIPNGTPFNLGTSTVVYTLTDGPGNSTSCMFDIVVSDTQNPTITCPANLMVGTDDNVCTATNLTFAINANDNCTLVDTTYILSGETTATGSSNSGNEVFNLGVTNVAYTVTDTMGRTASCNFNVTVVDDEFPVIACPANITVQVNTNTCSFIQPDISLDAIATDNCSIVSNTNDFDDNETLEDATFFVSGSPYTITWTAIDTAANTVTCTFQITVEDNQPPVASCNDLTVQLNAAGMASIVAADIEDGSSTDNCAGNVDLTFTLLTNPTFFNCDSIGMRNVALIVTDTLMNSDTCTAVVTVEDNILPTALCQNITIPLDVNGNASITPMQINNGSNDACGIASLSADITAFDCDDLNANSVILTVTDNNGNPNTCTAVVTIQDNILPTAICQDIAVPLLATGMVTITPNQINNGSTDNCTITSSNLNITTFNCNNVGMMNPVILTVTDVAGNDATCTANVTVQDTENPMAVCQDLMIQLDINGNATIVASDIDNGSTDNCTIDNLLISQSAFDCSNLGNNNVTLTVTDMGGNSAICTATVTVEDLISPQAICQTATVQLDATGNGILLASQVNASDDNCVITNSSVLPNAFTCANVGSNTVTLTVTDNTGNVSTCMTSVSVVDIVAPNAVCQNLSVALDASGNAIINANQINNGSTDACGILSVSLAPFAFDCTNVGANIVTLTVADIYMNIGTCTATVTVMDDGMPTAICQNITANLDINGMTTITANQINNGSTDNCGIDNLALDISSFNCNNVGANTVTLTVTSNSGNTATCTATVTVEDSVSPQAICQDATLQLDANGMATLLPSSINNGSDDACGISMNDISITPSLFTCANIGDNSVMLTVMDANGNMSTCNPTVTVADTISPMAICQNIDVELDAIGEVSITSADIDNGSNDACGIANLSLNALDIINFTCNDLGENTVTLTATDVNGNDATCTATVTVEDNISPNAVCQDISVGIGGLGTITILPSQINNGSTDNCTIANLTLDFDTFTCTDIGDNDVILTLTDNSDNVATCPAVVTITDSTVPVANCQDITVELDATGNATITAMDVDNGSSAACGTMNLVVSNDAFDCTNAGTIVVVVLTASDSNGNSDNCTANVTVIDNLPPVAMCMDITINLDATGNATLLASQIENGSTDACGIASLSVSPNAFTCANVGLNTVTLTATDNNGKTNTCTATVGVNASAFCTPPTITNVNGPNIADPCTCVGGGVFAEEVVIEMVSAGQMWTVLSTDLIDPSTVTAISDGTPYAAGTPFIEQLPNMGIIKYTLPGRHLDGQGYTLSATSPFFPGVVLNINNTCFYPNPVIVTDLSEVICANAMPIQLVGNAGLMSNGNPIDGDGVFTLNGNPIDEINPAAIGAGNFVLTYTFNAETATSMSTDDPGCTESVTTTFEIQNAPTFQGCNDNVTVVLGPTCEALVTPDVILEGDFTCANDYIVTLMTQTGQAVANPITSAFLGQTLVGTVTNTITGNSCSTPLQIEDSIAPTIDCQPITITCTDALPPFGTSVTGIDNCDPNPTEILLDQVFNTADNCTDLVPNDGVAGFVTVTRTYVAQDASGMQSAQCMQLITITRPDNVDFPEDVTWSCEQYATNPNIIDTFPIHPLIVAGFGTEFPVGSNGFGFNLTSMLPNDVRLSNPLPASVPPTPTGSGLPGVAMGAFCNYSVTNSQTVLGICGFPNSTNSPAFKILRTWTVLDWCTGQVITTNDAGEDNLQVIKVMDVTGPIIMGMDVNLTTNIPASGNNPATTNGLIPLPTATDNCSGMSTIQGFIYSDAGLNNVIANINANGVINPSLAIGNYFIGYTATDACGNLSQSPAFNLVVTDSSIPTMICDEITAINVTSSGIATVPANVFDDGSFDDCGMVTFTARRVTDNCGVTGNTTFGPTVTFCCADAAAGPINLVLQGTDCTGNTNSCMIIVNVGDNIAPTIACPTDATINCDTYKTTLQPQLLACNLADACESTALTNAGFGNVILNDNCGATAQPTVTIDLDNCSEGTITRSFIATDAFGNTSSTCTQTITITHVSDWVVEFGEDVTLNCGASNMTVADAFTAPEIFFETCEMIATSFQDETFTTVQNACFKVVRTWKVINWCVVGDDVDQEINAIELSETALGEDLNGDGVLNTRTFRDSYRGVLPTSDNDPDADTQDGFIIYQQTVKVIDEDAPVFVLGCNIPDVCITTNTCGATVTLPTPLADDCVGAGLVTVSATSSLGIGFGPFNNVAPSVYTVTYSATDNCGNVATCISTVEVNDCVLPSPVCVDGLVVELMATNDPNNTSFEPMVQLMINQINAGVSDNCPAALGGLKISFSPDISDVVRTYTCDNVGTNTVRMYVTDAAGLQDYCQTEIIVQANQDQCDNDMLVATLAGNVSTEAVADVENVMIHINSVDMDMQNMTDAAGMFNMNVPQNGDYTITPEKDDDHTNGVSTFDLVKISKHILNVEPLNSPYKMIAADANNSQSITTLDLVHIRKLILLITPTFTNNTSWRFVDANYVFPNPANPWAATFPEIISINNLQADQLAEDFVAIKIGDVNGSAQANPLLGADDRTQTETLTLTTDNVKLTAGETYAVAIHAANFDHFGYQFTLQFDTDQLAFEYIENGLATTDNFGTTHLEKGILTTSWHQATATKWANDQALFTLHFTALTDGNLQDALHLTTHYTTAEAYAANGDLATVDLQFNHATSHGFVLYQNRPNPFAEATTIGFYLPTAQAATLTITDLAGRTVYALTEEYEAGTNEVTITRKDLAATGVLYYRLETAEGAEVRKMVIE